MKKENPINKRLEREFIEKKFNELGDITFPKEVLQYIKNFKPNIQETIKQRRDFRSIATYTIDPKTAQDFDDALSVEYCKNGAIEIGVHIADVSFFVRPETAIDIEAKERATSIYTSRKVVPMLPEVLSNDLCSLKENEDRLTVSVVWTFDRDLKEKNIWIGRSIIRSKKRYTYEEVDQILAQEKPENSSSKNLLFLFSISKKLRQERVQKGSILLGQTEIVFKRNAPYEIGIPEKKSETDSHILVEELMLYANKTIAEFLAKYEHPFPYRAHESPQKEKTKEFLAALTTLGIKNIKKISAKNIQQLLKKAKGETHEAFIYSLVLRVMSKAHYTSQPKGHFALQFKHYTHFTSPIRRYPDIVSHRILLHHLGEKVELPKKELLEKVLRHATEQEKLAQEIERLSLRREQIRFIEQFIGQKRLGRVTGVLEFGIFITDEESGTDGLIKESSLPKGWVLDPKKFLAKNKKTKKMLRIGDTLFVKVVNTNIARNLVDYVLDDLEENKKYR